MRLSSGIFIVFSLLLFGCQNSTGQEEHSANLLINESSPYLLQHAYNPVNWHPWKPEVLEKAKQEKKLMIISVGYSSCHWCHVMEHESFEDTTVARLMNANFIPIKVDREERPDVDGVYMTACRLASGSSCGWPLNAVTLPDGRPVWAGTYFPKDRWIEILQYFIDLEQRDPGKLEQFATQITNGIQTMDEVPVAKEAGAFDAQTLDGIATNFLKRMDMKEGGATGAPKFPMPNSHQFLLKYHHKTKEDQALEAVNVSLRKMAMGGIYDQLGGGFARYSTDAVWKVPHFEKMLYDNSQLVSLYAQAYQRTGNELYRNIVAETLAFIEREMTDPAGGFYSSYDADSEGTEGKFYVWEKSEIDSILDDPQQAALFNEYFQVKERGNWEHTNILYYREPLDRIASRKGLNIDQAHTLITGAKQKLFEARKSRIFPGLDDKVLTSWNALMLKGYIDAYRAFGEEKYLQVALKNAQFVSEVMMDENFRLNRNYKNGKSVINAFLDDYALTAQAFIALYGVTFDEQWLKKAEGLAAYAIQHFSDEETGFFNYTSSLDPPLIVRKMEITDNAIPSSNSTMARVLHTLGLYLYNNEYLDRSKQMLQRVIGEIAENEYPNYYSNWCQLLLDLVETPYEIAIVGPDAEKKRKEMMAHFIPNAIFLGGENEGSLELLKDKLQERETYIYVCRDKICKLPVKEVGRALDLLD